MEQKELFDFAYRVYYEAITLLNPKTMNKITNNEIIKGQTPLIDIDEEIVKEIINDLMESCSR